jgi:branched-chain amino acid transport system substrate-binding protein
MTSLAVKVRQIVDHPYTRSTKLRKDPVSHERGSSTTRSLGAVVLLAALLSACESPAPAAPGSTDASTVSGGARLEAAEPKVAFVQDLSPDGAIERLLPTLQAIELAFATASTSSDGSISVEVVRFDTQGDPASTGDVAAEIAADETFVAAFAAPGLGDQRELVATLGAADVPVLSLSARDGVGAPEPGDWFRFVPTLRSQAAVLASAASGLGMSRLGICLAETPADGTIYANTIRRTLDGTVTGTATASEAIDAGCGTVIWSGDAAGGSALIVALARVERASRPVVIGGPSLLDPIFLELVGPAAEGVRAVCSCADVSTSLDLEAQRFIQDFQSEFGSPPVPYAVEGWDAAGLLLEAIREAGTTRGAITAWLSGVESYQGLGGAYAFEGGELTDPARTEHQYRVVGGRWVTVDA